MWLRRVNCSRLSLSWWTNRLVHSLSGFSKLVPLASSYALRIAFLFVGEALFDRELCKNDEGRQADARGFVADALAALRLLFMLRKHR
jgi:hypothetical protein